MKSKNLIKIYYLILILLLLPSCKNKEVNKSSDKTKDAVNSISNTGGEYKKNKEYTDAFDKFENKKFREAYPRFIELIKKYPNDLELNYSIGYIAAKSKNIPIARKFLLKTIEIDKRKWQAYKELAIMYKSVYNYKESLKWVKKVFKYEENDPMSNFIMGYLSNKLEKNDDAYIYYERAINSSSTYMLAYIHYGEFYFSRKQYDKAEKVWKEGLKKRYSNTIAKRLGSLYITTQNYTNALNIYNELIKRYPKNAESYFYIAKVYEGLNDFIKAEEFYKKSLSFSKSYDSPKLALAKIYIKQKKYNDALDIYKELNDKMIDKTTFYLYKQALILKKLKNTKKYNDIIKELKKSKLQQSKDYLQLLKK